MWFRNPELLVKSYYYSLIIAVSSIHFAPAICSIAVGLMILASILFLTKDTLERPILMTQVAFFAFWMLQIAADCNSGTSLSDAIQFTLVSAPIYFMPVLLYLPLKSNFKLSIWLIPCSLILWWLCGATIINYGFHWEFLSQMVLESKPLPLYSQVYHIEFSMLITAMLLLILYVFLNHWKSQISWVLWVTGLGLFISLHVVSTRTGLLGFWITACMMLLVHFKSNLTSLNLKKLLLPTLVFFGVLFALFQIPSLKNRISNTQEDLQTWQNEGDINHKSFSQRVEAWKATYHIYQLKGAMFKGVGSKNYDSELQDAYIQIDTRLYQSNRIGTHNQFLQWMATYGYGIPLIFLGLLLVMFWVLFKDFSWLWMVIPFLTSAFFESTLQRQAGVLAGLFLWIGVLSIQAYLKKYQKDLTNSLGI